MSDVNPAFDPISKQGWSEQKRNMYVSRELKESNVSNKLNLTSKTVETNEWISPERNRIRNVKFTEFKISFIKHKINSNIGPIRILLFTDYRYTQ